MNASTPNSSSLDILFSIIHDLSIRRYYTVYISQKLGLSQTYLQRNSKKTCQILQNKIKRNQMAIKLKENNKGKDALTYFLTKSLRLKQTPFFGLKHIKLLLNV